MPVAPTFNASSFIICANWSIPPAIWVAMAAPASFPDGSIRPYKSCSIVSLSPGFIPHKVAPASVMTASLVTVTSSVKFPYFKAIRAVMVFVMLAGYKRSKGFFANRTFLSVKSKTAAASAVTALSWLEGSSETIQRS